MERTRKNKKTILISFLLIVMLTLFCGISTGATNTYAEESTAPSVQKVIDETIFIAFKKGENDTKGKYITACFFVPIEYYEPTYNYGVMIVPKLYVERYITRGDYFNEFNEQGKTVLDVPAVKSLEIPKGIAINCGIGNINPKNTSLEFVFALYCKDKNGNIAYTDLESQTFDTSTAIEFSYEEEEKLIDQRLLDARLEKIARKTGTLSNSLFKYFIIGASAVVVIWGAYIGIRIAVAKKKEEKIDSRAMIKRFVIGIVIIFILAMGCPLLINGLSAWVG